MPGMPSLTPSAAGLPRRRRPRRSGRRVNWCRLCAPVELLLVRLAVRLWAPRPRRLQPFGKAAPAPAA
eukprot:5752788-Lingulodinium_polyedra.AAC.1